MKLTGEQRAILDDLTGPIRIAAGAGTGKTDTLRHAVVRLIEGGASPGQILCLTFTVEASEQMRRRVFRELSGREDVDPDEITVQTYHAFAAGIVREHALLLGRGGEPVLLDRAREWQLMLEALEGCAFDRIDIGWLPTFIGRLLALSDELSRHIVSTGELRALSASDPEDGVGRCRAEATAALDAYRDLKHRRNAIDFGDQIALAVTVLRQRPEVLGRLRERYRYLVLDEYQDTDVAQRELVRLAGEDAELVLAVGDVDQGIFGWRGASIHNMVAFPDDFPGAKGYPLSVNFRSGPQILDLANALIAPFVPPGGYARKPLTSRDGASAAEVEAFVAPHELDEADGIAERIAAWDGLLSEVAVLCRRRREFDAIFTALSGHGIEVDVDLLGGFWTRPEILDVLAWLRLLADPGDNVALARLLSGPAYRLCPRDLYVLAVHVKDENYRLRRGDRDALPFALADALVCDGVEELSREASERIADLRVVWRQLADAAVRTSLADLVGEIARLSGLASELASSPDPEAAVALRHLAKLRDLAQAYEPVAGSADLEGFVAYLDSVEDAEQDEDELRIPTGNAARLLTVHRAKGLEWDCVFVPGLAQDVFPARAQGGANPAEHWWRLPFELRGDREFLPPPTKEGLERLRFEEERRLLYVAVTRARRRLCLSRAWYYGDNKNARGPSPFWNEAARTGLVVVTADSGCPTANPHPLGIRAATGRPVAYPTPPPAAPNDLARLEADYEHLRALAGAQPKAARWRPPAAISVTALLAFLHDEEEFFWRYVRRIPAPPAGAATLGVELHRRIERFGRGAAPLGSEDGYDLDRSERGRGAGVPPEQLWANFEASRFASMTPLATEQPFTLYLGEGLSAEGRIDAIFEHDDGTWEVVDYKTGDPATADPLQLAIYGRAVEQIWAREPVLTWLFLRDGSERAPGPVPDLAELLSRTAARLRAFR
jgi:DNA helicase-2/ATP-dependent DNA helicase PcrA